MEYCKHCTASFYVCSGHLSHQADSVSHCAFCGGSLGSRTEEKSKRHRGKGQGGGRERQSRSRTLEGNGCLVSRILRLSLRSTGLPHTVRLLPHVSNCLSARKRKRYRGPDTTSPEPDRKEPRGRGILSRLAAQSLFRFRLRRRRFTLLPQHEHGRWGERLPGVSGEATRLGPATQGCSCRRGGRESPPHTTPKRLFPSLGLDCLREKQE